MHSPEAWRRRKGRLLETGEEVHRLFSVSRAIGDYVSLDFIRNSTNQRLLCYPSPLAEGPQPLNPLLMPFPLIRDGNLTHDGVDIREIPRGTQPLIRIADSFDTPQSGAPLRKDIFREAGAHIGRLWNYCDNSLPVDLSIETLCYIPEGEGLVACVPPNNYVKLTNPFRSTDKIFDQIIANKHIADREELALSFMQGAQQEITGTLG